MTEGIQITIPDFDDDDLRSGPTPFGRSAFGFGSSAGGAGSTSAFGSSTPVLDSPGGFSTPTSAFQSTERSYFSHSHSRGDSSASIDSAGSATTRFPSKPSTPFSHSAQPSVASHSFTKKPSFASIRNAFKSGKNSSNNSNNNNAFNDPPPMPPLEHSPYPVLKNPFNRSTSSLNTTHNTHTSTSASAFSRTATTTPTSASSYPHPRPPTPGSTYTSFGRAKSSSSAAHRGNGNGNGNGNGFGPGHGHGHGYSKSQHSHSGSIFHLSDAGSDLGHGHSHGHSHGGHGYAFGHAYGGYGGAAPSPPPVPRVPSAYGPGGMGGFMHRDDTLGQGGGGPDYEDDKVVMDPKTPSDFALHAVFIRFATAAEEKIEAFLRVPLDQDPLLTTHIGPGLDPSFDATLHSLGIIAQKHAKKVIDSIMRWRRSQIENVTSDILQSHLSGTSASPTRGQGQGHHASASRDAVTPHPTPSIPSFTPSSFTPSSASSSHPTPTPSTPSSSRSHPHPSHQNPHPHIRTHEIPNLLNERKSLAAIYIMCRALIAVLEQMHSRDVLGDALGYSLEETTFEQFRLRRGGGGGEGRGEGRGGGGAQGKGNRGINEELYATLLGLLANVRFVSVTDRFLAELSPVANGQVPKDMAGKYENLVKGLRHIKIKVWPPEAFEEGAEFMESLSKSYAHAHGHLKIAFAETLVMLLHPIGKTAQAETNNPQWGKAIETIFPRAREMMNKPRYFPVAFPLAVTSLCVAPQAYFLKHWQPFFESFVSKIKEKPYRIMVMNGLLRIVWTYLYRCQESASTTMSKLEGVLKHFFPPNRTTVLPADDALEPLTYIMHFILSRHPEYGRELCLELMQEGAISKASGGGGGGSGGNIGSVLAPERSAIAFGAVLLSLHNTEREVLMPSWPSSSDFSVVPPKADYVSSSEYLPLASLKPGMQDFLGRCASALAAMAVHCGNAVGHMSVFDEQWSYARLNQAFEESNSFVARRHADGIVVAYPAQSAPLMALLNTCFQAWPRLLHPSLSVQDAVDMLLQGVIHVEPTVADSAGAALRRFMKDDANAVQVVSQFNLFLFSPGRVCHDAGFRLHVEYSPLLRLWVEVVEEWVREVTKRGVEAYAQPEVVLAKMVEVEAASLFLLAHDAPSIHSAGVKVIRLLGTLSSSLNSSTPSSSTSAAGSSPSPLFITERLQGKRPGNSGLHGFDDLLDKSEQSRLEQWRKFKGEEVALRIADSTNEKDRKLWRYVYPAILQDCLKYTGPTLGFLREAIVAVVSRYHPYISYLGGLSSRQPPGLPSRSPLDRDGLKLVIENKGLIDQWHMWVKILCSTAVPPDSSRPALTKLGRDHSRAPSDVSFERERYMTTRGLFRHLTPFLDSEYTHFRDAAVLCISSFPGSAYPQLLEDLSLLTGRQPYDDPRAKAVTTPGLEQSFGLLASRQIHDDSRSRSGSTTILLEKSKRQERLHSAVARIYSLTAHLLQEQRSSARQMALTNILKFVRNTQAFLSAPDTRDNPSLHRLRRYFCGIVEQLFNELATLKDSDRFIPSHMHLTLYRLCEDWCQVGPQSESSKKRFAAMQKAVEAADPNNNRESLQRFRHETSLLSHASVGALMALCPKAFYPPDQAASSPTDRFPPELMKQLSPLHVLDRLSAIMTSSHLPNRVKGKNTLRLLLTQNEANLELVLEALRRAIVITDKPDSSDNQFFEVISDLVDGSSHPFTFAQIVWLGLTNLRHSSVSVRCQAFAMLEAIHQQHSGLLTMSTFEASVASMASATFIHAHRLISDFLAGEHPHQAISMLAQLGNWLPQLPAEAYDTNVIILLLQSLEFWIANIRLIADDKSTWTREGLSCLYHLTSLTLRYGQSHAEQILVLWSKVVEPPHQSNSLATVKFLMEQAHKVGNSIFVTCASNIIASLCQTPTGREVFSELCSVIDPNHMLPTLDHKLQFPDAEDMRLWEDLDALFADQPRLSLGSAQFAWLFLSDVALQRYWEMKNELPVLLHAIFTHLDHRIPFIRDRAHSLLFQLLRSWTPGYDELPDRSTSRSRAAVKDSIADLEREAHDLYWLEENSNDEAVPKMKTLCSRVIALLEPLAPNLLSQWGSLALIWGTTCPIRAIAFRSLQLFRALMPRVKKADFASLLGRLSNTVAAPEDNIQAFTSELFLTINAVANSNDLDKSLIPIAFWAACACLSTTVEDEFRQTVNLLEITLSKLDLDDPATAETLLAHRPAVWTGVAYVQPSLLRGLRSSVTSTPTMNVLRTLAKVKDGQFIDPTEGRLRDLYIASLPWCLHAMEQQDNSMKSFAEDISQLAARENRLSIQKIMNSFAKGHFRTRDDFLRQSVSSIREHYGAKDWTEVVTLLLGLILNQERWIRIHTMQVVKILFQLRGLRDPVELQGSELLMPLLRLLETDLAPQALDVLEEPITISGAGPAAKHVLRMSMHLLNGADPEPVDTTVFGVPDESGWSVAQVEQLRETCQKNVMAVFDTCSVPTRPSRIEFEPEVEALASIKTPLADDLNGIVKNIHELTALFNGDASTRSHHSSSIPTRRLEARVAAILAKSTNPDSVTDTPQTPFLDVFNVGGINHREDSDDDSDSDSDTDAFVFDSIRAPLRSAPNGIRHS